jgi:hypothetical protein
VAANIEKAGGKRLNPQTEIAYKAEQYGDVAE